MKDAVKVSLCIHSVLILDAGFDARRIVWGVHLIDENRNAGFGPQGLHPELTGVVCCGNVIRQNDGIESCELPNPSRVTLPMLDFLTPMEVGPLPGLRPWTETMKHVVTEKQLAFDPPFFQPMMKIFSKDEGTTRIFRG